MLFEPPQQLGRWSQWTRGDRRWLVNRIDTTSMGVEQTLQVLRNWIDAARRAVGAGSFDVLVGSAAAHFVSKQQHDRLDAGVFDVQLVE